MPVVVPPTIPTPAPLVGKLILPHVDNLVGNPLSAKQRINDNFVRVAAAFENTYSRDGTSPNTMQAPLDLNGHTISDTILPDVVDPTKDPFFDKVVLLLHANGTSGTQVFTDSSLYNRTHTLLGAGLAPVHTTVQKKFGTGSILCQAVSNNPVNGGQANASIVWAEAQEFNFVTTNFTIEFWFRMPTGAKIQTGGIISKKQSSGTTQFPYYITSTPTATNFNISATGNNTANATAYSLAATALAFDTWHHIALTRESTTVRLYVNGVLAQQGTITGTLGDPTNNFPRVGGFTSGLFGANGWMDDVRLTRVCRYNTNFAVPTVQFPDQ